MSYMKIEGFNEWADAVKNGLLLVAVTIVLIIGIRTHDWKIVLFALTGQADKIAEEANSALHRNEANAQDVKNVAQGAFEEIKSAMPDLCKTNTESCQHLTDAQDLLTSITKKAEQIQELSFNGRAGLAKVIEQIRPPTASIGALVASSGSIPSSATNPTLPVSGWIYLGRVNYDNQQGSWASGSPASVSQSTNANVVPGDRLQIATPTNLRADIVGLPTETSCDYKGGKSSGQFRSSASGTLKVLDSPTQVTVQKLDYTHTLDAARVGASCFVWALVSL